jgi:CubicO group peptidase (beta-lactamase class C family)
MVVHKVMEDLVGRPFAESMHDLVFEPADMHRTFHYARFRPLSKRTPLSPIWRTGRRLRAATTSIRSTERARACNPRLRTSRTSL